MEVSVIPGCVSGFVLFLLKRMGANTFWRGPLKGVGIRSFLVLLLADFASAYAQNLSPETVFREYTHSKMVSPFKGEYAAYDSFQVDLNIDDLKEATNAEIAINFWGGHIGTSDQTFKVNGSTKFDFPQPNTPGSPYCYYRFVLGNPAVKIPVGLLKKGKNTFTFFCGKQVCYSFNWPLYWLNSFTVRVYYNKNRKQFVKGSIKKRDAGSVAHNLVVVETDVEDPAAVASVEYIGYYKDYDLDGDGKHEGWQYTIDNGVWKHIVGTQTMPPYAQKWNNYWVPEQNGPIKLIAKINSRNGLNYLTAPVVFDRLEQPNSRVKMYPTEKLEENFASRVGRRKECNIRISDDLDRAISAYVVLSSWSGQSEDGAKHLVGINDKVLAESPGKLHDWALLRIPVPIEYLHPGDNTFFLYSETEEHAFEVNYPGPALLIRYSTREQTVK